MKQRIIYLLLIFIIALIPFAYSATPELNTLYQSTREQIQNKDFPAALSTLSTLVAQYPKEIKGWYNLGNVYRDLDKYPEAIEAYKKALELDPDFYDARFNMAKVYALPGTKIVDTIKAVKELEILWSKNSTDIDVNLELISIYYRRKELKQMSVYLAILEKIAPDKWQAYYFRGLYEEQNNELEKAREIFERGYRKYPGNEDLKDKLWVAYMRYANGVAEKGQVKEAYEGYKKAYLLSPKEAFLFHRLGGYAYLSGDTVLAIESYIKLTTVQHSFWGSYSNLANIYSDDSAKWGEATTLAYTALRWAPTRWEPRDTLGWIFTQQKDFGKAEKEFYIVSTSLNLNWDNLTKNPSSQTIQTFLQISEEAQYHLLYYLAQTGKIKKNSKLLQQAIQKSQNPTITKLLKQISSGLR